MPKEKTIARWLPLVGLTFAVFVFNTSEFMPIGLLSDIAADLHISEVRAGLLVSVYGDGVYGGAQAAAARHHRPLCG